MAIPAIIDLLCFDFRIGRIRKYQCIQTKGSKLVEQGIYYPETNTVKITITRAEMNERYSK